jgi:hypothetical protein
MRLRIQRQRRGKPGKVEFGITCTLELTSEERALIAEHRAEERIDSRAANKVRELLAGPVTVWHEHLEAMTITEKETAAACHLLAEYLNRATTYGTDDEAETVIPIGYVGDGLVFWPGERSDVGI